MTKPIAGLSDAQRRYKGLVVDLWGVLHNGQALFLQAVAALAAARAAGMAVILLSNAPRRQSAARTGLDRLGLDRRLYDDLITSGEVAWQAIQAGLTGSWGQRAFFFGAGKDAAIQNGLTGIRFVKTLAEADWILNVGPEAGHSDARAFDPLITEGLAHGLPMICANPDLKVVRGTQTEICAGAVAQAYAARGGSVRWYGKPYDEVYQAVYARSGLGPQDLLAIGDSFRTDVAGAVNQGMDVLFVASGIHRAEVGQPLDLNKVRALSQGAAPTYAADYLAP